MFLVQRDSLFIRCNADRGPTSYSVMKILNKCKTQMCPKSDLGRVKNLKMTGATGFLNA
ncbi:hypothetical protein GCM10007938_10480 [Vibrio zhanjiangensis]|uniref:Uncharacterized protein n=1 Tax=Vibrio zhanjiangensis TaxID=1046128 RepID=A0ABQ6EW17_9VIBR|nr:hypothetical protein GCM10007938_10480 [Vibrio zhanjiangensis]